MTEGAIPCTFRSSCRSHGSAPRDATASGRIREVLNSAKLGGMGALVWLIDFRLQADDARPNHLPKVTSDEVKTMRLARPVRFIPDQYDLLQTRYTMSHIERW